MGKGRAGRRTLTAACHPEGPSSAAADEGSRRICGCFCSRSAEQMVRRMPQVRLLRAGRATPPTHLFRASRRNGSRRISFKNVFLVPISSLASFLADDFLGTFDRFAVCRTFIKIAGMTCEGQVVRFIGAAEFYWLDVINRKVGSEPCLEIARSIDAAVGTLEPVALINLLIWVLFLHRICPRLDHPLPGPQVPLLGPTVASKPAPRNYSRRFASSTRSSASSAVAPVADKCPILRPARSACFS